jgi:hypothetical protein
MPLESCRRFASLFGQVDRLLQTGGIAKGIEMERVGKVIDFLVLSVSILMVVMGLASLLRF